MIYHNKVGINLNFSLRVRTSSCSLISSLISFESSRRCSPSSELISLDLSLNDDKQKKYAIVVRRGKKEAPRIAFLGLTSRPPSLGFLIQTVKARYQSAPNNPAAPVPLLHALTVFL